MNEYEEFFDGINGFIVNQNAMKNADTILDKEGKKILTYLDIIILYKIIDQFKYIANEGMCLDVIGSGVMEWFFIRGEDMKKHLGINRFTFSKSVQKLKKLGLLDFIRIKPEGQRCSKNYYKIGYSAIKELQSSSFSWEISNMAMCYMSTLVGEDKQHGTCEIPNTKPTREETKETRNKSKLEGENLPTQQVQENIKDQIKPKTSIITKHTPDNSNGNKSMILRVVAVGDVSASKVSFENTPEKLLRKEFIELCIENNKISEENGEPGKYIKNPYVIKELAVFIKLLKDGLSMDSIREVMIYYLTKFKEGKKNIYNIRFFSVANMNVQAEMKKEQKVDDDEEEQKILDEKEEEDKKEKEWNIQYKIEQKKKEEQKILEAKLKEEEPDKFYKMWYETTGNEKKSWVDTEKDLLRKKLKMESYDDLKKLMNIYIKKNDKSKCSIHEFCVEFVK